MNEHKYIMRLLLVFTTGIVFVVGLVFYVDPFQVFHKSFLANAKLNENQRYQNAGLINTYLLDMTQGYDSAAFGSSASGNFSAAILAENMGWKKTIRLFLAGGSPAETRHVVERAIASGRIKHIVLETDLWSMNGEYRPAENATFPLYLYNESKVDDLKYFVDVLVLSEAIRTLLGIADHRNGTPDMLGYWADGFWVKDQHQKLNSKEHVDSFATLQLTLAPWPEEKIQSLSYPAIDKEMAPLFEKLCNTDIEVLLFVPPYSMMYYLEKQNDILTVLYEPRYILGKISHCSNIRLHAFDTLDFTADLNNYKDHKHYLLHVSKQMLAWMHKGEHQLSLETIAAYEQRWLDKLNTQRIYSTYPQEPKL